MAIPNGFPRLCWKRCGTRNRRSWCFSCYYNGRPEAWPIREKRRDEFDSTALYTCIDNSHFINILINYPFYDFLTKRISKRLWVPSSSYSVASRSTPDPTWPYRNLGTELSFRGLWLTRWYVSPRRRLLHCSTSDSSQHPAAHWKIGVLWICLMVASPEWYKILITC